MDEILALKKKDISKIGDPLKASSLKKIIVSTQNVSLY